MRLGIRRRQRKQVAGSAPIEAVIARNARAIAEDYNRRAIKLSVIERVSLVFERWCGSSSFLLLHVVWFAIWLNYNLSAPHPFDPPPFGILTLTVSLEAILLSIILLMGQHRLSEDSDRRANLDLQINLLAERELTEVLRLLQAVCEKLEIPPERWRQADVLCREIAPTDVLQALDAVEKKIAAKVEAREQKKK